DKDGQKKRSDGPEPARHEGSLFIGKIHHPLNAILVNATSIVRTPECVLKVHGDLTARRERLENAFRLFAGVRFEADMNIVSLDHFHAHRLWRICPHKQVPAKYR